MRCRDFLAIAVLVLAAGGCSELDDTVVVEISTMVPSLSDSELAAQPVAAGLFETEATIQNMKWGEARVLLLTLDGNEQDLTFDEQCEFFDAWNTQVFTFGKCASGLIVDGDDMEHSTALAVAIANVTVSRLRPLPLPPAEDFDGDGVPNADDNCVLIDNPDQTDTGMKGYGDACAFFDFFLGIPQLDNDADTIADSRDNCPYTPNPGQEDSGTDFGNGSVVRDGIGDACEAFQQTARVLPDEIVFTKGPQNFVLELRRVAWLTLDFKDRTALMDCDWDAGTCTLMPDGVEMCLDRNGGSGC